MTTPPRRITIADLEAATGLGPVQVRKDVRAGLLPGRMRGRQYVCPPGEFDAWLAGEWRSSPRPQPIPTPSLMQKREKAS